MVRRLHDRPKQRRVDPQRSRIRNVCGRRSRASAGSGRCGALAAYVRALDLSVERLEQRYVRMDDDRGRERYHYAAPQFDFECELLYDVSCLVHEYPGIAVRVA